MKITAKVKCTARKEWGEEQSTVAFGVDYQDEEGREINAEWARYTPALALTMTVRKEVPFELGKSYTLTFDDGE